MMNREALSSPLKKHMNLPLFGAMVILNMVKDICQLLTRVNLDQKQELCLRRVLKIGWVSQNGAG